MTDINDEIDDLKIQGAFLTDRSPLPDPRKCRSCGEETYPQEEDEATGEFLFDPLCFHCKMKAIKEMPPLFEDCPKCGLIKSTDSSCRHCQIISPTEIK